VTESSDDARAQAAGIADGLRDAGVDADPDKRIIALIAYLQKLGASEKVGEDGTMQEDGLTAR
jgi:hypothetical protein